MTTRLYREADRPALERMAAASGFPYVDPKSLKVECVIVVVDDSDTPIAACAAHRIIELYGWFDHAQLPMVKLAALRHMHGAMARELREEGYNEASAFLPPTICERFGRRLERTFSWTRNWPSWAIHF